MCYDPDKDSPFRDLITRMFPPIPSSWPPLEAAIQKNTRYSKFMTGWPVNPRVKPKGMPRP